MGNEAGRFCKFANFTRIQKFKDGPDATINHMKGSAFTSGVPGGGGNGAGGAMSSSTCEGAMIPMAIDDDISPFLTAPAVEEQPPILMVTTAEFPEDVAGQMGSNSPTCDQPPTLFPGRQLTNQDLEGSSGKDRPVIQDGEIKKVLATASTDNLRVSGRSSQRSNSKVGRNSNGPLKSDIVPPAAYRGGAVGKPFPKRPMACKLSQKTWDKLEQLFRCMDQDGSNAVTRDEAAQFFHGAFSNLSVDAMFNEVDTDGSGAITAEEFVKFWLQVKSSGYKDQDILDELEELVEGGAWVDWKDGRDTLHNEVKFPSRPVFCRLSNKGWKKCEELFHQISQNDERMQITREKAAHFFKGAWSNLSADAMFNEVDVNRHGIINAKDFMNFWVQVKASGYKEKDIVEELDNLLQGSPWVDWKDGRRT